ncbi:YlbF family regulator [Paenibacillus sp. PR3]|uniref:UPF0342 protein H8B09_02865 n=1 Tax=Paenibacillus terricola TaxID=2763503 RepID=A0ABR8MPZ1_9BACL|nr:YlbF family regulator [Paenibacillus terricola]MBD3917680.1 YlbF family regulator [Paenibacillus terricola]
MNVYDKAYELAKSLRESAEAQALQAAKQAVDGDADAKRSLDSFMERQHKLHHQMMSGEEPSPGELEQMNKLYEVLTLNPLISKYFDAERRFSVLFEDVNRILGEGLKSLLD